MQYTSPDTRKSPISRRALAFAAAAGLIVGAGASASWQEARVAADEPVRAAEIAAEPAPRGIGNGVDSYAELVDRVAPAVVTVRMERRRDNVQSAPIPDDFFRRFFGDRDLPQIPRMPPRPQQGLGSGVIVRADGYILTNNHVVDGADTVTVELADRRRLTAKVVGTDEPSDLALLKIEATGLQALTLADSDAVDVGDIVLALGNPLGVGQTVTMGIISAKGRATGLGDGSFEDFIQTDAPINTGNSGGALVNTRGELVGINSQILSPSGGNIGIGFAIPASMARNVMEQLLDGGKVRRGQLGIVAQTIDSAMARSLGLTEVRGAIVADLVADSAAARAGLARGDVIVAVDGQAIIDSNTLRNRIASTPPGSTVSVTIVRDGAERMVSATLGELASSGRTDSTGTERSGRGTFGLAVEPLTRERARELGVGALAGLVITSVESNSEAASAGLRAGDVIEQVDGKAVGTVEDLRSALAATPDRPALVLLRRGNQTLFATLGN